MSDRAPEILYDDRLRTGDGALVLAPGCWDMFHYGHLMFLKRAANYGKLIVAVASDKVIEKDKGSSPIVSQHHRAAIISELGFVEAAIIYHELNFVPLLQRFRPTFFAVGPDWGPQLHHEYAEKHMSLYGGVLLRIPKTPAVSTTRLLDQAADKKSVLT